MIAGQKSRASKATASNRIDLIESLMAQCIRQDCVAGHEEVRHGEINRWFAFGNHHSDDPLRRVLGE
jgi:hypothetical protein